MNWRDLKTGTKLAAGFGLLIIISTLIGLVGYNGISNYQERVVKAEVANQFVEDILNVRRYEKDFMLRHDENSMENGAKTMQGVFAQIKELEQTYRDQQDLQNLSVLKQKANIYHDAFYEYVRIYKDAYITAIEKSIFEGDKALVEAENLVASQKEQMQFELNQQLSYNLIKGRAEKLDAAYKVVDLFAEARLASKAYVFSLNTSDANMVLEKVDELLLHIDVTKSKMRKQQNIEQLNAMAVLVSSYGKAMKETITAVQLQERQAAVMVSSAREFMDIADQIKAGQHAQMEAEQKRAIGMIISFVILGILLGIMLAYIITRSITKGITRGVEFATKVSDGDLTVQFDADLLAQKDEVGMLANALKNMVDRLKDVVYDITSGADNLAEASQELSSTSQQLSQGASEQAASTEEVSSSMEEMASNIQQNTTNAQETEKISQGVDQGIQKVGSGAQESLSSVKDIAQKITIINDIAFQTNILALNAAVEAARAGEYGKGFAVVAAEVQKLAERSKIAADEIGTLSKSSVEATELAGELMGNLIPEIQKTSNLVREISAASREQDAGADQINSAIQQLNSVTQQNAAASEEMASQADQLKEIISFFKVDVQNSRKSFNKPKTTTTPTKSKEFTNKGFDIDLTNNDKADAEFENY